MKKRIKGSCCPWLLAEIKKLDFNCFSQAFVINLSIRSSTIPNGWEIAFPLYKGGPPDDIANYH